MTVVTVPLNKETENALNSLIESDFGTSKADIIRKAINKLAEERAILDVLEAEREIKKGLYFEGDLDELVKKIT